jgi:hypothetical protein
MIDLAARIDQESELLACGVRHEFSQLERYGTAALNGLFAEYFQWSDEALRWLREGAERMRHVAGGKVEATLSRHARQKSCHPLVYKTALCELGVDVGQRRHFQPTVDSCDALSRLIASRPCIALGALYALESAAAFEHELLRRIAQELCRRQGERVNGRHVLRFHAMHLDGMIEAHRAELAVFLGEAFADEVVPGQAWVGAACAIESIRTWWRALIAQATERSTADLARSQREP